MKNYVSLSAVRSALSIKDSGKEERIVSRLIEEASRYIEKECFREFGFKSYTQTFDGDGTSILSLKGTPVDLSGCGEGTFIAINGERINKNQFICHEESGIIQLTNERFPLGIQNVEIKYRGGYKNIPADIEQACMELVIGMYRDASVESNENKHDFNVVVTPFVEEVLQAYRILK